MPGEDPENAKFLKFFGPPYKGICGVLTLKNAVIVICFIDIALGAYALFNAVMLLLRMISWGFVHAYYKLILIDYMVNAITVIFALIGIRGMRKQVEKDVNVYYSFKLIRFVFVELLYVLIIFNAIWITDAFNAFLSLVEICVYSAISGFLLKVVWSAYIRMANGQILLVLEGESAYIANRERDVDMISLTNSISSYNYKPPDSTV